MTTWLFALLGLHAVAGVGVLIMAKYSAVLVDEDGRPARVERDGAGWREHVVASHDTTLTITPGA